MLRAQDAHGQRLYTGLPNPGRGGRVAEGTRLLSEYGGQTPSRVRIPPSPSPEAASLDELLGPDEAAFRGCRARLMCRILVGRPWRTRGGAVAGVGAVVALVMLVAGVPGGAGATARRAARPRAASPRVLRVGSYRGSRGQFTSIQAAVDAAQPGDWILVGPGRLPRAGRPPRQPRPQPTTRRPACSITKPDIHLRGMDRNGVVVDGTQAGRAARAASDDARQDFGAAARTASRSGATASRSGRPTASASRTSPSATSSAAPGSAGNEIWWNGGDGSGKIGMGAFSGRLPDRHVDVLQGRGHRPAQYGIFVVQRAAGPGIWTTRYASNFNDSGYYIGACRRSATQTLDHAHAQYSALGYSGTNSGGRLVDRELRVRPQQGRLRHQQPEQRRRALAAGRRLPERRHQPDHRTRTRAGCSCTTTCTTTTTRTCRRSGAAAAGPVGTGDVRRRRPQRHGHGQPVRQQRRLGDPPRALPRHRDAAATAALPGRREHRPTEPTPACYDDWGNEIADNTFSNNGFFGNATNGDFGEITTTGPNPTNCFHGNVEQGGGQVTSSPSGLQQSKPACNTNAAPDPNPSMTNQVACDSQFFASLLPTGGGTPCPPGSSYPHPDAGRDAAAAGGPRRRCPSRAPESPRTPGAWRR